MTQSELPLFFLFLGESDREGAISKVKAAGWEYKKKRLESRVENWESIIEFLAAPNLAGVLVKFTNSTYDLIARPEYESVSTRLFSKLQHLPHIVFVHESFLTGISEHTPPEDDETDQFFLTQNFFAMPAVEIREQVHALMNQYDINIVPYKKNAELTVLASSFIDQNEKNLIFRLYVPSGRIWSAELDKSLKLFRDYLGKVSQLRVREDQKTTNQGVIYEFFGDRAIDPSILPAEFAEFSQFLEMCVSSPKKATEMLVARNIDSQSVQEIVDRYSKEARRLHVDLKHEREKRVLSIRQRMEAELVDESLSQAEWDTIEQIVETTIPLFKGVASAISTRSDQDATSRQSILTVNIRPQIINSVKGIVAQEISGSIKLGPEAEELLKQIEVFGDLRKAELTSAVYELEDPDARQMEKFSAKQKLKGFIFKVSEKLGDVAFGVLQTYIETKVGM